MEENYLRNDLMDKDKYGDWCVPPESLELIRSKDPARMTDGEVIVKCILLSIVGDNEKVCNNRK